MRVFLYEYFTGGGLWQLGERSCSSSLMAEARAMVQAVTADFVAHPNLEVLTTRDFRLSALHPETCGVTTIASENEEHDALTRLAKSADWTLLIAPETGGALLERGQQVERAGGRLLSPSSAVVEIAGNKQATMALLGDRGVPIPRPVFLAGSDGGRTRDVQWPIVVKPVDGCGSQGVRVARNAAEIGNSHDMAALRFEEYVPGLSASVAVLCGPAGNHALPTCEQRLSSDGHFTYLGGRLPLQPQLDGRARRLALATVAALPQPRGYLGVDLVLGEALDGSGDRVIEINPRLTTSYVGLRIASRTNLAAAMLDVVNGRTPDLWFNEKQVAFTADGQTDYDLAGT